MYLDKPAHKFSIHGGGGGGVGGGDCGGGGGGVGGGECGEGGGGEVWRMMVVVVYFFTEFLSRNECNNSRKSLLSLVFTPVCKILA